MKSTMFRILVPFLLANCSSITDPSLGRPREISIYQAVSGEALDYLGLDGRFEFPGPEPDGSPIATSGTARQVAEFVSHEISLTTQAALEQVHRGPISFAELRSCGSTYYALSPFLETPTGVPATFGFFVGSHWLVALCDRHGHPMVSAAVAAHAIPTFVDGTLQDIPFGSISLLGIPPEWAGALPATAESAVLLVARLASRRVVSLPVLYAPDPTSGYPQGAFWAITIDREATFVGSVTGRVVRTNRVFVGSLQDTSSALKRGPVRLFLEAEGGRRTFSYDYRDVDPSFLGTLHVRPGTAIDFEAFLVAR